MTLHRKVTKTKQGIASIHDLDHIIRSTQSNVDFCKDGFAERFVMPYHLSRLRVCGEGQVAYTWARPLTPLQRRPTKQDWLGCVGPLWIVDLIFTPDVTPRQAVRYMNQDMRVCGIAHSHEKYLFWREGPRRYGYARA